MERINIKMSTLPKATYRFRSIPIKIPVAYSTDIGQVILKFVCNHKRPQIAKTTLTKMNKAESIMLPDFKKYYKPIIIKTIWY